MLFFIISLLVTMLRELELFVEVVFLVGYGINLDGGVFNTKEGGDLLGSAQRGEIVLRCDVDCQ
jgi:hypothetical protein